MTKNRNRHFFRFQRLGLIQKIANYNEWISRYFRTNERTNGWTDERGLNSRFLRINIRRTNKKKKKNYNNKIINKQPRGARALDRDYLFKDLKENKRFMCIGPTMAKWPRGGGVGINFASKFSQDEFFNEN